MSKPIDMAGKTFGFLTVLRQAPHRNGMAMWVCKCVCDKRKNVLVRGMHLRTGAQKSCGCKRNEQNRLMHITHGMTKTKFYGIWRTMKARCNNPNTKDYELYGARGVKVLWQTFEQFRDDMYEGYLEHVAEYGERNTSIDRIDTLGNYSRDNCRWATWRVQAKNRHRH